MKYFTNKIGIFLVVSLLAIQCSDLHKTTTYKYEFKAGWPSPTIPENNPLTLESIALGRKLFFDKGLSVDSTISCASCHIAQQGFADVAAFSTGINGRKGFRNSGTLTNIAYLPYFNRDGGVKTLDIFATVPIEDHDEMGFNMLLAGKRLGQNSDYAKASQIAYGRAFDGFVITRSIASFLRTFISDNSIYDQYKRKEPEIDLSDAAKRGEALFFSEKGQCSSCHSGIHFSDFSFQNNGLKESYVNSDRGRERITLDPNDEGKFRVATLRNVELTAPYMHNGSLNTLKEVLQHYSGNGKEHKNESPLIDKINLTPQEEVDIISFLKTLTDDDFITNPAFGPELEN